MRGTPLVAAALLLGSGLIAGCLSGPTETDGGTAPPTSETSLLPDLSDVPASPHDAKRAVDWWEAFVTAYPKRGSGSPTNKLAAEQLARDLAEAGFEAHTIYYVAGPLAAGGCVRSPTEEGLRVVYGIKQGTEQPERVIAWVSHYDAQAGTIYAAYDDGSGNAVGMELARMFGGLTTRKTLLAIFFDAEELGLVTSRCFVQEVLNDPEAVYDLVVGHDMVGINWPGHEWPMYQMVGEDFVPQIHPLLTELYYERLGLDPEGVVLLDVHDRNSDERRFKEAGIPIIRMAGGRKAVDYPEYHKPGDTPDYVYQFAGSREDFEAGVGTVLLTSYWSVQLFDRVSVLEE